MDPITIAMLLSGGLQAVGQIKSGQAAAGQASQNAEQMILDRELRGIQAKQEAAARMDQLLVDQSSNDAWFAFSGRDTSDKSVKAFMAKQDEIAKTQITRGDAQARIEQGRMTLGAAAEQARGRSALKAGYLNAFSTVASGLYNYSQVAKPSTTPTQVSVPYTAGAGAVSNAARPVARPSGWY